MNDTDSKVRITMFLDGTTLKKFKNFAQLTNGKYQSLLNECLNNHGDKFLDKKLSTISASRNAQIPVMKDLQDVLETMD